MIAISRFSRDKNSFYVNEVSVPDFDTIVTDSLPGEQLWDKARLNAPKLATWAENEDTMFIPFKSENSVCRKYIIAIGDGAKTIGAVFSLRNWNHDTILQKLDYRDATSIPLKSENSISSTVYVLAQLDVKLERLDDLT